VIAKNKKVTNPIKVNHDITVMFMIFRRIFRHIQSFTELTKVASTVVNAASAKLQNNHVINFTKLSSQAQLQVGYSY
jgi:hypothetical protein